MAGLSKDAPNPVNIVVHRQSQVLEVAFDNGRSFRLPFELLRVYSPSAEVRGHGAGQEVLQTGKRLVDISALDTVGNYAVKPVFSDGHESGLYSWDYLYWLGENRESLWADYLKRLDKAGASRDVSGSDGSASGSMTATEARRGGGS